MTYTNYTPEQLREVICETAADIAKGEFTGDVPLLDLFELALTAMCLRWCDEDVLLAARIVGALECGEYAAAFDAALDVPLQVEG